jgi:hypothetical protein
MRHLPLLAVAAFTATFLNILAMAADMPPPPPDGEHHKGPPPFAIEACKGQSEGATVSFNGPDGKTFKGVCHEFNGTLAAMPDHPPGLGDGEHKGPPAKPEDD